MVKTNLLWRINYYPLKTDQEIEGEIWRRINVINGKLYWVSVGFERNAMESQREGLYRDLDRLKRGE